MQELIHGKAVCRRYGEELRWILRVIVPTLAGCDAHARSLNQLMGRIKEPIELCLDVQEGDFEQLHLLGVQTVAV